MNTKSPMAVKRFRNKLLKNLRAAELAWEMIDIDASHAEKEPAQRALKSAVAAMIEETVECPGEAHSNGFIDHCGICLNCTWGRCWK